VSYNASAVEIYNATCSLVSAVWTKKNILFFFEKNSLAYFLHTTGVVVVNSKVVGFAQICGSKRGAMILIDRPPTRLWRTCGWQHRCRWVTQQFCSGAPSAQTTWKVSRLSWGRGPRLRAPRFCSKIWHGASPERNLAGTRVARWHKIPIWVNFGGPCNGICW
jgi:hypothetical protein